ncbi:16S rRNA (cytidine(1402)-2'-O)-methyltransferase [Pelagibacteraceae bacterium]|jgi:16S rRNA (cytidine1402-2'-O)-methyltransferase|nr:16S rRNA (cytidine(1402)-2'-O)-methyltransferase [Pelagibacteraceae bacterium]MDC1158342.1 16S rRNA (cytidine(1402)-2'-O)-methyltransferase [Pelagibacteraceae bacterium]
MKLSSNSLYIVSTPIGNLDDITLRAISILKSSDIILCEDTRRSLKLLNHFKIKKKLISYHKFNETKKVSKIIEYINQGKILSLISDAGTPLLSDPGRILVNKCIENKIKIVPIPGVSSIITAMSVSGFRDQFLFYGFLPKTANELKKKLAYLSEYQYVQIFFIPALKINFYLSQFKQYFSGRKILIAKELTKIHEFFFREDVDEMKLFNSKIKGELTVIISEKNIKKKVFNEEKIVNKAKKYLKKYSLRDTVELIVESEKINKKEVYKLCLKLKNENFF